MQNVTSNQLLLHLFHEDDLTDSLSTRQILRENNDLREEFEGYRDTVSSLKTCILEPDERILRNILAAFQQEKNTQAV